MEADTQGRCILNCALKREVSQLKRSVGRLRLKVKQHKNALKKLEEFNRISRSQICGVSDILKDACSPKKQSEEELVEEEGYFF